MTFDDLYYALRGEHKNLCAYLTDLDEATTGICEPGGSIDDVKRALWNINDCYHNAFLAVNNYEREHKEQRTMTAQRSEDEVSRMYCKAVELRDRIEKLDTDDVGLALDKNALDTAIVTRWRAGCNEYKYNRLRDAVVNAEAGLRKYQSTEDKS